MKRAEKVIWWLGAIGSMSIVLAWIMVPLFILVWIIFFDRTDDPPAFP